MKSSIYIYQENNIANLGQKAVGSFPYYYEKFYSILKFNILSILFPFIKQNKLKIIINHLKLTLL